MYKCRYTIFENRAGNFQKMENPISPCIFRQYGEIGDALPIVSVHSVRLITSAYSCASDSHRFGQGCHIILLYIWSVFFVEFYLILCQNSWKLLVLAGHHNYQAARKPIPRLTYSTFPLRPWWETKRPIATSGHWSKTCGHWKIFSS
jgi:hypothetical protein